MAPSYVVDTSAICDLEGINEHTSLTDNADERERVWQGLERLIDEGRLITVRAARDEFKRRCPTAHARLQPRWRTFFARDSAALFAEVQEVLRCSPQWQRQVQRAKPNRDRADYYIVALARLEGRIVVTNEKHKNDRSATRSRADSIPDVCDRRGVHWRYLVDFVADERLLLVQATAARGAP